MKLIYEANQNAHLSSFNKNNRITLTWGRNRKKGYSVILGTVSQVIRRSCRCHPPDPPTSLTFTCHFALFYPSFNPLLKPYLARTHPHTIRSTVLVSTSALPTPTTLFSALMGKQITTTLSRFSFHFQLYRVSFLSIWHFSSFCF